MRNGSAECVVVGVDVGGPRKGFHAVALAGSRLVAKTRARNPVEIADWCRAQQPVVVAVDAPCRWRGESRARQAERQMAAKGIRCYYAPTEARARAHAFYTWMLPGRELFDRLTVDFPLYAGGVPDGRPCCIETFPHAVACALAGEVVSARTKRVLRPALLARCGVARGHFASIDEVDAALCALAAGSFARGAFTAYGDPDSGFIIVPATPAPGGA